MEVLGTPPVNVQFHCVGEFVLRSVKSTDSPAQIIVESAVKSATGGFPVDKELRVISSMAKEGSEPLPSLLFIQRKPILRLEIFSQDEGKTEEYDVHIPLEPFQTVVFAVLASKVQPDPPFEL